MLTVDIVDDGIFGLDQLLASFFNNSLINLADEQGFIAFCTAFTSSISAESRFQL
ncbi:hypothetical protein [Endozoicomonas sp. OPT23]|uniref:hypothetical protein n=1 Tax=Endozoicomonas sp. OPT23 TaxID=2072845 RepID=UPI00351ACAEC